MYSLNILCLFYFGRWFMFMFRVHISCLKRTEHYVLVCYVCVCLRLCLCPCRVWQPDITYFLLHIIVPAHPFAGILSTIELHISKWEHIAKFNKNYIVIHHLSILCIHWFCYQVFHLLTFLRLFFDFFFWF